MRILLRASAVALAATSTMLGSAVAAQAAPASVTVTVDRLIFQPAEHGHTGSVRITVRNNGSEPFDDGIIITEAVPATAGTLTGTGACGLDSAADDRRIFSCSLGSAIAPGATSVLTANFRSPAKPQAYAQIAPVPGSVEVGGITAQFPALFRSTTGSLGDPIPYVQDTTSALSVTTGDVTLTRQEDGTFAGRLPVTVRNGGDAPHTALAAELATPAGIDSWPSLLSGEPLCVGGDSLPEPPGGFVVGCFLSGEQLAEGQERTLEWLITAPAGTVPGALGSGTALVETAAPGRDQSAATNVSTFAITVAG